MVDIEVEGYVETVGQEAFNRARSARLIARTSDDLNMIRSALHDAAYWHAIQREADALLGIERTPDYEAFS